TESTENANLERQNLRYVKAGGDFIWWSERSGWGHYYLYDHDGKYKNAITAGDWRAEAIAEVDSVGRVLWFRAVGREDGEVPYYTHLYRVNLDGSGLALLDAGDATHNSTLSPSRRFIVDTYSRIDLPPKAVLRDAAGRELLKLEETDVSRLTEYGWKPPERFVVKAADGVTNIFGNIFKPFDFDPSRKYPIIANVYPGPQTEQVTYNFAPTAIQQRLAQLGFIVIQIGNRGGSPQRSNAYQHHGYFNLRDYGLADKKAGIEQLATRFPWIDIDRVGIFGHSGGGFMTAAALLQPPYNDFFKVGVSSAGNHDNNVYNQNWSEQYHGLKEIRVPRNANLIAANGRGGRNRARGAAQKNQAAGQQDGQSDAQLKASADTANGTEYVTKFDIHIPANHEIASNLKGRLLLVHGDMDNNVHPAGTIRLANALIKANKRFDLMLMPGKPHGYGDMQPYYTRLMMEYFAEHLLGDYYRTNAEMRGK
ncbi:MAG TPA: prolyl oligopeptidase family serine peptidase, partial [Longimicrobiales bacterium]|nr:prolyl oligopeptidase family serine peptidase [Longimicrobiales bacterium]